METLLIVTIFINVLHDCLDDSWVGIAVTQGKKKTPTAGCTNDLAAMPAPLPVPPTAREVRGGKWRAYQSTRTSLTNSSLITLNYYLIITKS